MTHDPYDTDNRNMRSSPGTEDPYVRRPSGSSYGGSGIAFVIFGVVAVLLIGFAMFGGYSDNSSLNTSAPSATTEQTQVQPQQPATQPEPAAPATNNSGSTNY